MGLAHAPVIRARAIQTGRWIVADLRRPAALPGAERPVVTLVGRHPRLPQGVPDMRRWLELGAVVAALDDQVPLDVGYRVS